MTIRPYLMVMKNSMMSGLTYRAHFIFMALTNIVYLVISFFLWQGIYGSSTSLNGLSFAQTYLQISLSMGIFTLLLNWVEWFMSSQIQKGDIVRYLTRPLDYQFSTLFDSAGGTIMNFLGIALPTFIFAYAITGIALPPFGHILFGIVAILFAFLISFFIDFLVGLLSFITTSIWGFSAMKEIIVLFCSGALIPLQFFPNEIRDILSWLPFQAIYNAPIQFFINPELSPEAIGLIFLKQIAWVVILFLLARGLYKLCIRKMVVNGG